MVIWWHLRDSDVSDVGKNLLRVLLKWFQWYWDIVATLQKDWENSSQDLFAGKVPLSISPYLGTSCRWLSTLFYFPSSDETVNVPCWPKWAGCYVPCVHLGMLSHCTGISNWCGPVPIHALHNQSKYTVIFPVARIWLQLYICWVLQETSSGVTSDWFLCASTSVSSGSVHQAHQPLHLSEV